MKKSASAGLKVRVRLSPPLSMKMRSLSGNLLSSLVSDVHESARLFHAHDLFGFKDAVQFTLDVLGVFCGDHVVGDDERLDASADKNGGDGFDDGRLAGADRAAHADASDFFHCVFLFKKEVEELSGTDGRISP